MIYKKLYNLKIYLKVWKLFGLWAGEAEVLALSLDRKLPIIRDDKKCINAAKATSTNFITTLDLVIILFKKGYINKENAKCFH
jgi:predicted nucleic acid-binding protein